MSDANEYITQEEEEGYQLELSVRQAGRELLSGLLDVFYRETTEGTWIIIQNLIRLKPIRIFRI